MKKLQVDFDFVEIGNDVEVGALILNERNEVIKSRVERFSNASGNNYHFTINAWLCSIKGLKDLIDDGEYDLTNTIISFRNQNRLVFKWAETGKFGDGYAQGIEKLYSGVNEIVEILNGEVEFTFITIKGKDNQVKKILKKRKDKLQKSMEEKMSFGNRINNVNSKSSLNSGEGTNVVSMFNKKRAEG